MKIGQIILLQCRVLGPSGMARAPQLSKTTITLLIAAAFYFAKLRLDRGPIGLTSYATAPLLFLLYELYI